RIKSTHIPYTTLLRSWKISLTGVNGAGKSTLFSALLGGMESDTGSLTRPAVWIVAHMAQEIKALNMKAIDFVLSGDEEYWDIQQDRKSTRLNSSHVKI